jgi:geranylgeranyl diphosphate synthase type I
VAVELIHNFSLVHDDLIDRDTERRHRPTVWTVWDDTTAILVGDAMSALAHEVLASSGSPRALTASQALGAATRELIRGQAQDVAFEERDDVTLDECLSMVAGKTGALLAVSAEIGAILSGADEDVCEAFRVFGAELGMAFQIVDDLLGVWGATEVTGKPVYADLAAGKKNLPVVWSLENGGDAGAELAKWFAEHEVRGDVPLEDLEKAAGLIEQAGGRRWATQAAEEHVAAAIAAIDAVDLTPAARAHLVDLARFVTDREQ